MQTLERRCTSIEEENKRLREENERLRDELRFLRTEVRASLMEPQVQVQTSAGLTGHCCMVTAITMHANS
jgi:regulator of replication initiation timing